MQDIKKMGDKTRDKKNGQMRCKTKKKWGDKTQDKKWGDKTQDKKRGDETQDEKKERRDARQKMGR